MGVTRLFTVAVALAAGVLAVAAGFLLAPARAAQGVPIRGGPAHPRRAAIFAHGLAASPAKGATITISFTHGATLQSTDRIAPNTFGTIFGANFVPATRLWNASFQNGVAPTELEGIKVLINGKRAFISFVGRAADFGGSSDQVNFVAPDDAAQGRVEVVVENARGDRNTQFFVNLLREVPAFFPFDPEGRRYLAAVHADGTLVGKAGLFGAALTTRPVKPGDRILLYGTGFGRTNPAVPVGQIPTQAAPLVENVALLFGQTPATLEYAGLSGFVGVYQFNVVVPNVGPGDVEIRATIAGVQTPTGFFLTVAAP